MTETVPVEFTLRILLFPLSYVYAALDALNVPPQYLNLVAFADECGTGEPNHQQSPATIISKR